MTKEEKFLLKIYEKAKSLGDDFAPIDRFAVGEAMGLSHKGVNRIVQDLAKTNFIVKRGDRDIQLTQNGIALILKLID